MGSEERAKTSEERDGERGQEKGEDERGKGRGAGTDERGEGAKQPGRSVIADSNVLQPKMAKGAVAGEGGAEGSPERGEQGGPTRRRVQSQRRARQRQQQTGRRFDPRRAAVEDEAASPGAVLLPVQPRSAARVVVVSDRVCMGRVCRGRAAVPLARCTRSPARALHSHSHSAVPLARCTRIGLAGPGLIRPGLIRPGHIRPALIRPGLIV